VEPKRIQVWTHPPDSVAPSDESVPKLARAVWPDAHHIWVQGRLLIRSARSLREDTISAKRASPLLDAIIERLAGLGTRIIVETAEPQELQLSGLMMSVPQDRRFDFEDCTFVLLPEDPRFLNEAVELLFGMHRPWALIVMRDMYSGFSGGDLREWVAGVARRAAAVITEHDGETMDILLPGGQRVNDLVVEIMDLALEMDYSVEYGP